MNRMKLFAPPYIRSPTPSVSAGKNHINGLKADRPYLNTQQKGSYLCHLYILTLMRIFFENKWRLRGKIAFNFQPMTQASQLESQ